jgi:hypothetical protein
MREESGPADNIKFCVKIDKGASETLAINIGLW